MTLAEAEAARASVDTLRLFLALAAAGVLGWGALVARRVLPEAGRHVRDVLLAVLALVSAASWWSFGQFHFGGPDQPLPHVHVWDAYHYYVGAKYFDELGYTGLYECTTAADIASSPEHRALRRRLRNLETNEIAVGRSDGSACRAQFDDERWAEFEHDVAWFRDRIPNWNDIFVDWGFNATPVWTAMGIALTRGGPVTDARIGILGALDLPLLVLAFASLAWAFGWRTTCVVLVFWGTNLPSDYTWVGGGILRQAWFALLAIGLSLLRRDWLVAGGAALMASTLLRIFPGATFLGLAVLGLARLAAKDDRARFARTLRIAAGASATLVVLVAAAAPSTGGLARWGEFIQNSIVDTAPSANNIGLEGVLSFRERSKWAVLQGLPNSVARWEDARAEALHERRWLHRVAVVGALAVLGLAVLRRPRADWSSALIALGIIPVVFDLSSYYQVTTGFLGLLSLARPGIGVGLCLLAAFSRWLEFRPMAIDELHVWLSVGWLVFTLFAALAWQSRDPVGQGEGPADPTA